MCKRIRSEARIEVTCACSESRKREYTHFRCFFSVKSKSTSFEFEKKNNKICRRKINQLLL
jgi:hypothetical protein